MSAKRADDRDVLMDLDSEEAATPSLRGRLVSLDEPPPADAQIFDKHFALLDERDHARNPKAAGGKKPPKAKPTAMEEAEPEKSTRRRSAAD